MGAKLTTDRLPFGHTDAELPSGDGVHRARARLAAHIQPTPSFLAAGLSAGLGFDAILKVETLNRIGCFKLRGALNSLLAAKDKYGSLHGAATSSTGNHGQGVALAAKALGIPARIFVPSGANPVKVERIRRLGAEVLVHGKDIDEAKSEAQRVARTSRFTFVDDGEDLDMMNGAGTVGLELAEAFPALDEIFVPMGSGTLAAGVAAAYKSLHPKSKVTTVQPEGSPAMTRSFHEQRAVEAPIQTIADGLVCRVPARRAVDAIVRWVDDALLVGDGLLLSAMRTLLDTEHLVVEPSGAAALAGAWKERSRLRGKRVGLILTGANVAPETFQAALAATPLFEARGVA